MGGSVNKDRLLEVTRLFLRLGVISFGGPAASIALMEQETVQKRGWLTREHFLDLLAAVNLVPGPNATEMAIHLGWVRAGWPGLIAGGSAFILPAAVISLVVAVAYSRMGTLPQVSWLFYGISPAVIAVILVSAYRLGRVALRDTAALVLGLGCLLATKVAGVNEAVVLLAAGLAGILIYARPSWSSAASMLIATNLPGITLHPIAINLNDRVWQLGAYFLKVGSLLFGSGMVLFALIHRDVVTRYAWLTERQLVDAIAVGQMTPGPVSSAVTFIGYLVAGVPGALVSTAAMFLPSFVIVTLMGPWIPRLRKSPRAKAFLDGVNVAVVALILSVTAALLRSAIVDVWTATILLLGLIALQRFSVGATWIILGGALAGLARHLLL